MLSYVSVHEGHPMPPVKTLMFYYAHSMMVVNRVLLNLG